jgi:hypothetical protein
LWWRKKNRQQQQQRIIKRFSSSKHLFSFAQPPRTHTHNFILFFSIYIQLTRTHCTYCYTTRFFFFPRPLLFLHNSNLIIERHELNRDLSIINHTINKTTTFRKKLTRKPLHCQRNNKNKNKSMSKSMSKDELSTIRMMKLYQSNVKQVFNQFFMFLI